MQSTLIKWNITLLSFVLLLASMSSSGLTVQAQPGSQTTYLPLLVAPAAVSYPPTNRAFELELLQLINAARAVEGLQPLVERTALTQAARRHARDVAANDLTGHDGSDGSTIGSRLNDENYSWSRSGEVMAWGSRSPTTAVAAWLNSSSHRAILLSTNMRDIGVAYDYDAAAVNQYAWVVTVARER